MKVLSFFKVMALVLSIGSIASCGKQVQIVKGVTVSTTVVDDQVHVRVASEFDFGNIMFPSLQIPINHHNVQIGSVSMIPVLGSKTQFVVEINASELIPMQVGPVLLPNGTLAPLIATNNAISINLGSRAQFYSTIAQNVFALGVAIPIAGLDGIGNSLGGINFFPMFSIDKAIGAAGIFASKTAGQNGFGFFVDLSQYMLQLQTSSASIASAKSSEAASASLLLADEAASTMRSAKLSYAEIRPSKKNEDKLNNMLYDMHKRKVQLKR